MKKLSISFNFFIANVLTVFEAGLALKTHGSFVNGFTPLRAGVAGFFLSFMFKAPASLKDPFFFNCSAATATMPWAAPFVAFSAFIGAMAVNWRLNRDEDQLK